MATTMKGIIGGGGLTISASPATISIPTGYLVNEKDTYNDYITKTITIPSGIKVINVYASCYSDDSTEVLFLSVSNDSNHKFWLDNNDYNSVASDEYIGVTPNKQYSVTAIANAHDGNAYIDSFYIQYSPEINNKTPTVTDY